MPQVLILHGPNLNLLGSREPEVYGRQSLDDINTECQRYGQGLGLDVSTFQSNSEGTLVDRIQQAAVDRVEWIIINPAAYTHTSVALRDALLGTAIPFIEVHLSNVHAREGFRHNSYFSDRAVGVICGFGAQGYRMALDAAALQLKTD
ncbi:type II 3-dehydroquinate dehydratase [Methylonatrum kenyense]|uniref:type II 3-dehydroquinate dehydratase n=1 Tax=Methylonatrum kenyense TaxID=455253 RepID=UPI0020BED8DA|nr:type II 3-dehydroquinate dehydratase [Methylonatrum kenyense]MCK8515387.1 type II 3-dehydroquinate dehydratase [Methylonatrum kenyense]